MESSGLELLQDILLIGDAKVARGFNQNRLPSLVTVKKEAKEKAAEISGEDYSENSRFEKIGIDVRSSLEVDRREGTDRVPDGEVGAWGRCNLEARLQRFQKVGRWWVARQLLVI
ncbi:hypothetical protein PAAG_06705 [Paracoccidioides lutzii Pb01]|uniref:Uncharacterized protein n=1 Tax=Paracoccidioides lutzii (strain ATCC MYA-826 / Pb01) TaxID=502779 RepID=C1H7G4_PARBA|nr:hypothetical protein PAAG_06705 [Paracoccidioides lutzii Pb01]EEH35658.2 hypothetical protein PAAG_06705 [Paracoccidioides lutzii Pb01]